MLAYEFRFLNARGKTLLQYFEHCFGDMDARSRMRIADDLPYAGYEIWQDDRLVDCARSFTH